MTWAPYQEAVACDTLPQRGAAAIIRKPPGSTRSRPTARTVTRERRAWRRGASDEGAAAALAGAMRLVRRPVEYARYAGMEGPAALPAGGASTGKGDCVRRSPTPPVHTPPAGGASAGGVCVQAGEAASDWAPGPRCAGVYAGGGGRGARAEGESARRRASVTAPILARSRCTGARPSGQARSTPASTSQAGAVQRAPVR